MIKSSYKKRKRGETFRKKALTVGGIVAAGVTEAATGYKVSGAIGTGISKTGAALGTAGKNIKTFGGNVKKSFMDSYNPPAPKKIPKSRRLNAANLKADELTPKPKRLPMGSGKDQPGTIHRGQGDYGVIKGATKNTRNRPKPKPVLHGSYSDPLGTKGQTIGGRKLSKLSVKNPTIGMPTGPGTKVGNFKPKLTLDSKLMSDYKTIEKTKASAKKRQANLIKNAPGKAMQPGDTVGARSKARASVAGKVKASRKRTLNKVTKIQKGIDTKAKQIAKDTGRTTTQVKKFNKRMSTPSGKDALNKAYLSKSIKPKVKLNAAAMLNPAGIAIDMAAERSKAADPSSYTKGIFGADVAKKSIPGFIAQTPTGKKIKKRVSRLKSKVKTRFKF